MKFKYLSYIILMLLLSISVYSYADTLRYWFSSGTVLINNTGIYGTTISWNNLTDIPAGFADGTDDGGSGNGTVDYSAIQNFTSNACSNGYYAYDRFQNGTWKCRVDNGSGASDTNESIRVNRIVSTNCTGQVIAYFYSNGTGVCEADDSGAGGGGSGYNSSTIDIDYFRDVAGILGINQSWWNGTFVKRGTLNDGNWCQWDNTNGDLDCDVTPVSDSTCDGSTCDVTSTGTLDGFEGADLLDDTNETTRVDLIIGTYIPDNISNHETTFKHGNTTTEIRGQFSGSNNISIVNGEISFNLTCIDITGSADLCDGNDATGGAGAGSWPLYGDGWLYNSTGSLRFNTSKNQVTKINNATHADTCSQYTETDPTALKNETNINVLTINSTDGTFYGLNINGTEVCTANNGLCNQTDTDTTYSNGSGISLVGTQFNHSDTSSQASSDNSGRTYIQDVVLDIYGHITSIVTATETVVDQFWSVAGSSYIYNNSGTLDVNETKLNGTIDARDTDTNCTDDNSCPLALYESELDDESELEAQLADVSNVYTDNDNDSILGICSIYNDTAYHSGSDNITISSTGKISINISIDADETNDLLIDGTRALTANWDAGAYHITAQYFNGSWNGSSLYYLKTEIDTQGEVETIWGVSLATDAELTNTNESVKDFIADLHYNKSTIDANKYNKTEIDLNFTNYYNKAEVYTNHSQEGYLKNNSAVQFTQGNFTENLYLGSSWLFNVTSGCLKNINGGEICLG